MIDRSDSAEERSALLRAESRIRALEAQIAALTRVSRD
jgi:hypothetical protein